VTSVVHQLRDVGAGGGVAVVYRQELTLAGCCADHCRSIAGVSRAEADHLARAAVSTLLLFTGRRRHRRTL